MSAACKYSFTVEKTTPTIEQILASNSASFWLKDAIRSATQRDCVDAYFDAKLLAEILKQQMDKGLGY